MCAGNRSQPSLWKDVRRLIPEKSAATSPRKSPSNARPSVHSTGGERGFGSRRRTRRPHRSGAGAGRTRSAEEENAASPPSRGSPAAGAPRPHCAPAPGDTPLPRGRGPGAAPALRRQPPARCPRRTGRRDLRGPGGARGWRAPPRPREVGKGKCGSRTEGYSQEMAGALRPPPASPQGEASKAAAASEQQLSCRRRSLEPPGVAGTGGDFTTSLLGDCSFAAAPDQWQSPRNWGRANETRSPSSLHAPAQGLTGNCSSPRCSSALAPPPSSKAPPPGCPALGREAGQPGSGWGEFRPDREPGTGAEFLADRPGPGRAGLLLPAARAGTGPRALALPRGGRGSHAAQAPHRWPPEKESWP